MDPPSSEEPRTMGKRPRFLSPEKPLEKDDEVSLELKLGLPSHEVARTIEKSPPDEMESLRQENRMLKERITMLGIDCRTLARCLHQIRLFLADEGPLPDSKQSSGSSPVEEERNSTPIKESSSNVPLKGKSLNQEHGPEAAMNKVRVSLRTRVDGPKVSDGCQWRKYGQKDTKGNAHPRAYYRCSMSLGCPARKLVQKCAENHTLLSTTYQGEHNHPLSPAARAMFSRMESAAEMLLSGSLPTWGMIKWDMPQFFYPGVAYVSADQFLTVILDMSNLSSSSGSPLQRNLQIIETNPGAMVPRVDEGTLRAAVAVAMKSIVHGIPKP